MTRLAVVIAVYNNPVGLQRTLESLDAEEGAFDIYVVDDGSVPAVALDSAHQRHETTLLRHACNLGVTQARNTALEVIMQREYEYVAVQDAGDLDVGDRMTRQMAYLDAHPDVALVGAWAHHVSPQGKRLFTVRTAAEPNNIRRRLRYSMAFVHPTCMFRIAALREIGVYTDAYPVAEDYELVFRFAQTFDTANIQYPLVIKEEGPFNESVKKRRQSLISRIRIQSKYFSFRDKHAYVGLLYSIFVLLVPYDGVLWVKRLVRIVR